MISGALCAVASARISSSLPRPTSVAGSAASRIWKTVPAISAPALRASSTSSRSDSRPCSPAGMPGKRGASFNQTPTSKARCAVETRCWAFVIEIGRESSCGTCAFRAGLTPQTIIRLSPQPSDTRLQPRGACADQGRFAKHADPWENGFMRKLTITAVNFLAAAMMLMGNAQAQQTPAANTQQAPTAKAAPAPAAGAQKAPAAKTGQAAKPRLQHVLTLKTQKDKVSYAVGMNVGTKLGAELRQKSIEVDPAILLRGVKDALAGGKMLLTEAEARAALTRLSLQASQQRP